MKKLTSLRMKEGMSYTDCLLAISDNVIGLIVMLPEVGKKAASILKNDMAPIGMLSLFDAMRIYGNDLAILYSSICKKDHINILTIIWAFEIGSRITNVPDFAKLETIEKLIQNDKMGIGQEPYPFEEARVFVENYACVRFPVIDFSFLEEEKGFLGLIKNAWAFVVNKDARILSEFNFPNGAGMSVRDAKRAGLMS